MSIEKEMLEIAKNVFNVEEDKIVVESRFKGGMSNYTFKVLVNGEPFTIRKIGEGGEPIINLQTEKQHLDLIAPLGISSEIVYFDTKSGIKVSKYIEGTPLSQEFSEDDYKGVADTLHKLHHSNIKGADYDLKNRLRRYEKLLKETPSHDYHMLKMFWLKMYDEEFSSINKVFCHGDAQRSNFVKGTDKLYLLDWEFTGMNDPFYDIASFGNINFDDAEKLLSIYLDRPAQEEELRRLRFYRMYQVLQWHIVATYKHEIGLSEKLHLDFQMIADKYLKFAATLFEKIKG
ncbi:phosphotransferase family protein [Acholeplasma equirhinis]|uniref:choline/ethanolamine kinase family protein n=1 Tax=Acholeplasma equirhinis TaxID=555393 RepID=UPI00197A932E|nr:choline/ethanolamine kinase family protein [Acholeplasma equirhinis]MBN3490554.1 phosphotransferase family protein [Acholeplasma equirhinis]